MRLQRARVDRVLLEKAETPIRSPRTGARMRIIEVPEAGGENVLTIERVIPPSDSQLGLRGRRWTPEHVHLDFDERFEIMHGIADAELAGTDQRLAGKGTSRTLYVGAGMPHVNPTNRDITDLVYKQTFTPATEGASAYVRTLAQVLRDGRDDHGDLPWSLVLAIGDVTRERTYVHRLPYSVQRRLLLPLGRYVAGTCGYGVQLARRPRKASKSAVAKSPKRRGEVRRTT